MSRKKALRRLISKKKAAEVKAPAKAKAPAKPRAKTTRKKAAKSE
jgi:hypothetical protein